MDHPEPLREPLLATKLFVPRLRRKLLPRTQLHASLSAGLGRRLTLVSAPAGFGKTTLIAGWLASLAAGAAQREHVEAAWLSLEPADNEPQRFWSYALTAIERRLPGVATRALAALGAPQSPDLRTVLTLLLNDLAADSRPAVLVLDDLHLLSEPAIFRQLSFLIAHSPPRLHLVVLTRSDPPLDLAGLRARDELNELRANDLRCGPDEVAALLDEVAGLRLDATTLATLVERSEGWLVGLQLFGLWLSRQPEPQADVPALRGDHHLLVDYLVEQVLRQQPAEVQQFLLRSSVLGRLSASLCDAVVEREASQQMLDRLERENLFVIALDPERRWFRYHHLFAHAMMAVLAREAPAELPGLHRRASAWLRDHGHHGEAVRHALLAEDWQAAAHLIAPLAHALIWSKSDLAVLRGWLAQLPPAVVLDRPELGLAHARLCILDGQIGAAEAALATLEGRLERQAPEAGAGPGPAAEQRGKIVVLRALGAGFAGEPEAARRHAARAGLLLAPGDAYQQATRGAAMALAALHGGHVAEGAQAALSSVGHFRSLGHIGAAVSMLSLAGHLRTVAGELAEASSLYQQGIALGSAEELPYAGVGLCYANQAELLWAWGRLDEALDSAHEGLELAERARYTAFGDRGHSVLVRLHLARGELVAAGTALRRLLARPLVAHHAGLRAELAAGEQVRLWLALGQGAAATSWLASRTHEPPFASSLARERQAVAAARVCLASGQPGEALALLAPPLKGSAEAGRRLHQVEIQILRSLAFGQRRQARAARDCLAAAVALAAPSGAIGPFRDEGDAIGEGLRQLRASSPASGPPGQRDRFLAAIEEGRGGGGAHQGAAERAAGASLAEPLSQRELEVLRLLAEGASNDEVAERLVVTYHTVKNHVSNLMGKLGVNNRTRAVAQARALGLLEP